MRAALALLAALHLAAPAAAQDTPPRPRPAAETPNPAAREATRPAAPDAALTFGAGTADPGVKPSAPLVLPPANGSPAPALPPATAPFRAPPEAWATAPAPRPSQSPAPAAAPPPPVAQLLLSPRPAERPENLVRKAVVAASGMRVVLPPILPGLRRGGLCGDPGLEGERLQPIPGRVTGCGVAEPVRITAVAGIALSQPATLDCNTARTLRTWVEGGLKPAVGRLGGGVAEIAVAAHYACRPTNNQRGARISEHGRGHAIDISGLTLRSGATMTVLRGWDDPRQSKIFRAMHRTACGPFGTVLGPGSDGFHRDHLHFDTAKRGGAYCR